MRKRVYEQTSIEFIVEKRRCEAKKGNEQDIKDEDRGMRIGMDEMKECR